MTNISICWEVAIPPEQKEGFTELVQGLATKIEPGDSLKEICIIADDTLVSRVQSFTGKPYQHGLYYPEAVAIPIEQGNTFLSSILIRQAFFLQDDREPLAQLYGQISTISEELLHCHLYHQTWQRRGYIHPRSHDFYSEGLHTYCGQMHDEYAVSRLKNMLFGRLTIGDGQGQFLPPYFIEYGASLAEWFDQAFQQLHTGDILQFAPADRKTVLIPFAYRFIFEPLARHTGFRTPIPLDYQLRDPDNNPEGNVFFDKVIALYWISIKSCLEASFDSQFIKTEEALQTIANTMNSCLDELLEIATDGK